MPLIQIPAALLPVKLIVQEDSISAHASEKTTHAYASPFKTKNVTYGLGQTVINAGRPSTMPTTVPWPIALREICETMREGRKILMAPTSNPEKSRYLQETGAGSV